jgi:hypothetical protein
MRRLLILTAAMAALGCKDTVAPTPASPAGQYPLRSVNGNPPPQIVLSDADGTVSFVGGLVILRADGTFRDSTDIEIVTSEGVARTFDVGSGTYRLSNDTVFFTIGQSEYVMVRNGVELRQDFDGIELVYRR